MAGADDQTVALLQAWHDGDRKALAELVDRDRDWIVDRVRARRGPLLEAHADTLDDAHDLILQVMEYAPRFVVASRRQFRALVARMAENMLADKARRLARRRPLGGAGLEQESRLCLDPSVSLPAAPSELASRNEEREWLRLGLEFLDDDDRRIVHRHRFEGRTFSEIGQEEGLQESTARMRFHRAMLRLAGLVQRLQAGDLPELLAGA